MNELTNYQQWQADCFGDILPEPTVLPSGDVEGKNEELNRFSEWVELQAEQQLFEYEKD